MTLAGTSVTELEGELVKVVQALEGLCLEAVR